MRDCDKLDGHRNHWKFQMGQFSGLLQPKAVKSPLFCKNSLERLTPLYYFYDNKIGLSSLEASLPQAHASCCMLVSRYPPL